MKKFLLLGLMFLIGSIALSAQVTDQKFEGTWSTVPVAPGHTAYDVDGWYVYDGVKKIIHDSNPADHGAYFSGAGFVRSPKFTQKITHFSYIIANKSQQQASFKLYKSNDAITWHLISTKVVASNSIYSRNIGLELPYKYVKFEPVGESPLYIQEIITVLAPLPIELNSFSASQQRRNVELKWETASETNNDFFTVERSRDGRLFAQIGYVSGADNSSTTKQYTFIDKNPKRGMNYYRLSQTDFDGHTVSFDVVTTEVVIGHTSINPTNVKDMMILNFEPSWAHGLVTIYNFSGQKVFDTKISPETTELEIDASIFPQGQYVARISFGPGAIQTIRFIKY